MATSCCRRLALSLLCAAICIHNAVQQSIPVTSQCDGGSTPVFLLQHNVTEGVQLRTQPTANFLDCSEYCASSNDCVGVEYSNGVCHVIGAANAPYQSNSDTAPLITKNCVKSERVCASPFHFDVHEQKILVGFAREVVPADSIQVCLSACLNAFDNFGFECESVMYYPVDQECILNTEDRLDRPDLFVDEHDDTVTYLDNNCAGSQCYAPYVTQYVAVEGRQLKEELDRSFVDVDLESCEELCTQRLTTTVNEFNCKSFMYNNETRTCILSDERSKPLGRGNLVQQRGFTYYEKKCFASFRTCRNVPSFTRVPQMLLVGFAAFVMENVPSVTMCLDQCTNPPPETGDKFVCKSAMYYYNEQECILNAESRHTKPDLFIPEEEDFVVDYFDINCQLEKETCPAGKELHTVKTLNAALPEGESGLHVLGSTPGNVPDCMTKCYDMSPEKCRSFNYDKEGKVCNLSYLDGKTTLRPQVKQGVDLYDMHCLQPVKTSCMNKDGALYSRYLYTKQSGLPKKEFPVVSLTKCMDLCSDDEQCQGVNYNRRNGNCAIFESVEGEGAKSEHVDFYKNLCRVKETDNGASSAANVPKEIVSTNRNVSTSRQDQIIAAATAKKKPSIREPPAFKKSPGKSPDQPPPSGSDKSPSATLEITKPGNKQQPAGPPVLITAESVHTICNYEGIKVQIKNNQEFSGVVFVKNKYDTCRVEVEHSDSATLVIGLPSNFGMKPIVLNGAEDHGTEAGAPTTTAATGETVEPISSNELRRRRETERDCGLVDMDNGTYKTIVVVQTNNLGIPGLVTSMDQIYEVSCDYSSMLGGKVTAAANLTVHGPKPSLIQPRGKIELGNPVLMQMNSGNGGHQPVVQAKLGDILELRWEIMAMDEELDFFVKDCYAEPGGTNARSDEKLQLIEAGCPTPAVAQKLISGPIQVQSSAVKVAYLQAFRFDSSSTVRVTCHLEICKGNCKPTSCSLIDGQKESWGRKKRSDNSITEFETKRYKVPRFAQATTSLVIVDPLQQISEPSAAISMNKHASFDFAPIEPPVSIERASVVGQMCMNKLTLFSVLGTLLALILIQALIVTKYIFKRVFIDAKHISSSSQPFTY